MADPDTEIAEGFPIGEVYRSEGRAIPEGECQMLTSLTWTTVGLHVDEPLPERRIREMVLAAPGVVAIVSGLWVTGSRNRHLREKYGMQIVDGARQSDSLQKPTSFRRHVIG